MVDKKQVKPIMMSLALILVASLVLGLGFQLILRIGDFWDGFFASSLLTFIVGCLLYLSWRAAGRGKTLAWMIFAAFLVRFALGVFLACGLPRFGYPEPPQQAGFVFEDAYRREVSAWELAKSDAPISEAFSDAYETDQYGGLLALSALIYRIFSPEAFRPALISIVAAGAMALSVPFLFSALGPRFSRETVLWAGWILALFPEGILLGSAQMREPFFILIFTIMIWSAVTILDQQKLLRAIIVISLSGLVLFLFSFRIALPMIGMILLLIWVDLSSRLKQVWIKWLGWAVILIFLLTGLWFFRYWLDAVLHWDTLQTVRMSGRVQFHLESLPEWLHFPFILVYGLLQPVLPAAIAAPAPWIWRALGIFRALGWYALAPLLVYAALRIWRLEPSRKKRWLLVLISLVWIWVVIASARAGGDQWDNPRYRTIFLPWMALVGGWAIQHARHTRDAWLGRILMIEGIFLAFFTNWYLSRYYPAIPRLTLGAMVIVILVLSLLVILLGWLWDRKRTLSDADNEPHSE